MYSQWITGQRKHAPQLTGTDDADSRSLQAPRGSGLASTAAVCARRKASKAVRMSIDSLARIAAANSAAFFAPAAPMAKVATGMPLGIWAIDSSESMPFKTLDCTGTPSTGREVFAAVVPGKCAAPPAPAMMALRPRSRAEAAYSNSRSGVRCAEITRTSCAIPRRVNVSAAACIVSQSEDDPIMTPTKTLIARLASSRFYQLIRAADAETQKARGHRPANAVPSALFPPFRAAWSRQLGRLLDIPRAVHPGPQQAPTTVDLASA